MTSVPFSEAFRVWWRIGLLSFGGPAGQIALMHRILVEEKRWIDEARFLHALNYCMLLPGPEAQQLATYIGWLMHGVRGGLAAGGLFIVPGAAAILALSWLYVLVGDLRVVEGLFFGLKAAVLAIVVQALLRIGGRTLHGTLAPLLALTAFVSIFAFGIPFPVVVLTAGLIGYASARGDDDSSRSETKTQAPARVVHRGSRNAAFLCLALWVLTVCGVYVALGGDSVFAQIAIFFSKMALVTFGGAYAVLAYVAQQGVETYGWLLPGEMIDGLGLAETTPGPLILVTQFVGFLAAYRHAGIEPSLLAATFGALLTTWVTFLPCFVWIFAGAPYVERLRGHAALSSAMSAITAAVVGVIANLALWFALNVLFAERTRVAVYGLDLLAPLPASVQWPMVALTVIAFSLVFGFRCGVPVVLTICAALGALWTTST